MPYPAACNCFANDRFGLQVDSEMGNVVDVLDSTGVRENTLILVTGDNGPWECKRPPEAAYWPPPFTCAGIVHAIEHVDETVYLTYLGYSSCEFRILRSSDG